MRRRRLGLGTNDEAASAAAAGMANAVKLSSIQVPIDIGEVRLAMRIIFMKRCGVCRSQTSNAEPIVGASTDRNRPRRPTPSRWPACSAIVETIMAPPESPARKMYPPTAYTLNGAALSWERP